MMAVMLGCNYAGALDSSFASMMGHQAITQQDRSKSVFSPDNLFTEILGHLAGLNLGSDKAVMLHFIA